LFGFLIKEREIIILILDINKAPREVREIMANKAINGMQGRIAEQFNFY
jgi:hypothetical protein